MCLPRIHAVSIVARLIIPCIVLTLFLSCFFKTHWSFAEEKISKQPFPNEDEVPWKITAEESLIYREKEELLIGKGNVAFKKGDRSLQAQEATYNRKTGIATVSGNVRYESGEELLTAERGVFDLKARTGRVFNGRLFLKQSHYYISGDVLEKLTEDTYTITNCRLTTCDSTSPAWSITGSKVRVAIEDYGTVKHAAFWARTLPFFYVPYMMFPSKRDRQTGLLPPMVGYSDLNGVGIEVPFFWAISDQTDATFYQRYLQRRGYMQGLEFRYIYDENSKGVFLYDRLSDKKDKDLNDPDDVKISPFPRTNSIRYWFRSKTDQDLPVGLVARLDVDYVSDQDYLREFERELYGFEARPALDAEFGRPIEERKSPFRTSALRLSRDGEGYSLQGGSSYYQRPADPPDDETPQPLVIMSYNLLQEQVLNLPLFFSLDSDYVYIWREVGIKGNRLSFSPELTLPLWLGNYLQFEPSFRYDYTLQWFDDAQGDKDFQDLNAHEARVSSLTKLERIYETNWSRAKRLKHRIWPELSYTYRVLHDEEVISPWFEPIDVEGRTNKVSFCLENFLDARLESKKGDITYRQWATLNLCQSYDFDEAMRDDGLGQKRPFDPLNTTLTVTPFSNIYFRGVANWDHYEHKIASGQLSSTLSLERSGGRKDSLQIDYGYVTGQSKTLNGYINVNLSPRLSLGTSLKRDILLEKNTESGYWLGYNSQCWGARVVVEKVDDVSRFMVNINLLGLGEVMRW
jgi:LPS-assembly protein